MSGRQAAQRLSVESAARQRRRDLDDDGHIDRLQDGREMVEDGTA